MKKGLLSLLILASAMGAGEALAFPQAPFDALSVKDLPPIERGDYDFEGIVKLSNCSGSLVRFSGQPESSPAYVLTNGHCLGGPLLNPKEVVVNRPVSRGMMVSDKEMRFTRIEAKLLVYATMSETDIALYQLNATYAELAAKDIRPLELDHQLPIVGTPIDIVSGFWERGYRCNIDGLVFALREHVYTFLNAIRYSSPGCEIIGGTSGSPVIAKGTRTVVGINNTTNESGGRCSLNNPCEVDDNGNIRVLPRAGYGQQTYRFYSCLTPDFRIDLAKEGCNLPRPN